MHNPPGILTSSKSHQFICQNCSLIFQSQKTLDNHQNKFCSNPKYNDLELLQQQFQSKSKGRDISLYGNPSLINVNTNSNLHQNLSKLNQNSQLLGLQSVMKNNNPLLLDKQYQSVLDQLTNKQLLKKKLQKQKNQAYQELQMLDKRQNDMLIDLKHDQLHGVLKRRKQLEDEQQKIQQEMKSYQSKKKQLEKQVQMIDKEDYIFKQARYAGKLAKQRQILQQRKKQMEHNLKLKRKQKAQIQHRLNQSKLTQPEIYIPPNFRKNNQEQPRNSNRKVIAASNPSLKAPQDSLDSLSFQNTNRGSQINNSPYANHNAPVGPPSYNHQNVGIQHWAPQPPQSLQASNNNNYQSPLQRSTTQIFNLPHQKSSFPSLNSKPGPNDETFPYFTPEKFSKNQKLLTDMLNKTGKSQEDAFIQMLNAQQYDSLNLLSKIPKTSQLYQVKLKQYQQISKLRDEYKKQAHQKRIDKMKRQFEYQKKIMAKQIQNALWVDENRKLMLAQQINIVKNQQEWQRDKDILNKQAMLQKYQSQNVTNGINNINNQKINTPLSQNKINPVNNANNPLQPSIQNRVSMGNGNPYDTYLSNMQQRYSAQKNNIKPNNPQQMNNQANYINQSQLNQVTQSNQSINQNQAQVNNSNRLNSQQPVNDSSNYMWGYKISVQMLKNYMRTKPIKIKLIIKQHDVTSPSSQISNLKYEYSTSYHYQKIAHQSSSYNPNMNNKYDNQKNVVFKQDFTIPLNLQQLYNQKQNQLYLWIFALEKDQSKLSNQPSIYAWYNLKLTHFGQLKQGKFTVNLYSDNSTYPNPSDMNKKKNKLNQEIVIQLNQVLVEKQRPPEVKPIVQQATRRPPQVVQIGQNNNSKPSISNSSHYSNQQPNQQNKGSTHSNLSVGNRQSFKPQNSQTSIINQMSNTRQSKNSATKHQVPFIPLEFNPQFINTTNKQPKNLDIILAQLRTLPSQVGPVKIQLSFIDADNIEVLPRQQVLTQTNTEDMYNPFINYIKKIRNQKLITPTTMIFIRLLALNALDYEIYMLGFTVFYIFFNQNGDPCPSNDSKDFLISNGFYQLPIFWGTCKPFYSNIEEIIDQYPLIPCASLLFGCQINNTDKPTKIPRYSQKVYNTALFHAEQNQLRLFEEQYKRQKLDSNKILSGYLKFKGFTTGYTPDQAQKYFFKAMGFTKDNIKSVFPLQYMAQYHQFFGVYFSVDKLIIPEDKQNYYYFMTVCLCPPAKYYTSKLKDTDDIKLIWAVDPENSLRNQVLYKENDMIFQPKYDMNTCLIVQFKRIKIGKQNQLGHQIQNYAYLIVPLFRQIQQVRCVNVNKDVVNTYPGAYNLNDINMMKKDLPTYLDKLGQTAEPSGILFSFRVMNGYFTTQYNQDIPQKPKNRKSSYLSWYSRPIDFQDANRKVKLMIQKKYGVSL